MGMLAVENKIVVKTLRQLYEAHKSGGKVESIDTTFCDFDQVRFCIKTQSSTDKTKVLLSVSWGCIVEMRGSCGLDEHLKGVYGPGSMQGQPESEFDYSFLIDIASIDCSIISKYALMKRYIFQAALIKHIVSQQSGNKQATPTVVRLRDDTCYYITNSYDRVTVMANISFSDSDDKSFGDLFLKEFEGMRKKVQEAPQVMTSAEPPKDLVNEHVFTTSKNNSFVTILLFPRHYGGSQPSGQSIESLNQPRLEATSDLLLSFRNYIHYHIKCSKAYLQTRMRVRVNTSLQVLNRARPEKSTNHESNKRQSISSNTNLSPQMQN